MADRRAAGGAPRHGCRGPGGAGGRYYVCPVCFNAKQLGKGDLLANAELGGTMQLWEWIGDDGATTFSY